MTEKPWTFEPFEMDAEQTYTIYDPNLARIVAVFRDGAEAQQYLDWRNRKQAKKARKQRAALDTRLLGAWS